MGDRERTRVVTGVPLSSVLLASDRLRTVDALALVRGVLSELAQAHERDVVHGDVAPTNILIDLSGSPTLVGFGSGVGDSGYAAPEVVAGAAADERSDVYSACVVFAELLRGEPVLHAAVTGERAVPDLSGIDTAVAEVLGKGLEVGPRHRLADASELLALLDDAAARALGDGWLATASLGALGATATAMGAGALTTGAAGGAAGTAALGAQAGTSMSAAATLGTKAGSSAGAAALGSKAGSSVGATALGTKAGIAASSSPGAAATLGSKLGAAGGKVWMAAGAGAAVVAAGVVVVVLWPESVEQTAAPVTTTTTTTTTQVVAAPPPLPPPPPAGPRLDGTYSITATFRTATVSGVITVASDCAQCDATFTANGMTGTMTWNGTGWERTDGGHCLMRVVVTPTSVVDGIVETFSQVSTILSPGSCGVGGDMTGTGVRTG